MTKGDTRSGQSELRAARRQSRGLFASVFAFSVFVNLLMLTGPIFMLQVYDRVLGSRSEATLVALFALYFLGGDVIRGFVFAMIWGVIVGTYSSIFVASTTLLVLGVKRDWSKPDATSGTQFGNIDT